jgi:hypothetical protein
MCTSIFLSSVTLLLTVITISCPSFQPAASVFGCHRVCFWYCNMWSLFLSLPPWTVFISVRSCLGLPLNVSLLYLSIYDIRKSKYTEIFQKISDPLHNSGWRRNDMKQVPYWGPTDINCHPKKCSGPRDPAPGTSASVPATNIALHNIIYH